MLDLSDHSILSIRFCAKDGTFAPPSPIFRCMTRARPYDRNVALDAALSLFWRKGYHATSLKDLEVALRMKPGSIYAAFDSKHALYLSVLERYFLRTRDELRTLRDGSGPVLKGLAEHLRGVARREAHDPGRSACMLVRTMLDATAGEAELGTRARSYLDAIRDEIEAAFRQARADGELPDQADTALLAQRYQSNMTALRIEAHRGLGDAALIGLAEQMAQEIEALGSARLTSPAQGINQ